MIESAASGPAPGPLGRHGLAPLSTRHLLRSDRVGAKNLQPLHIGRDCA